MAAVCAVAAAILALAGAASLPTAPLSQTARPNDNVIARSQSTPHSATRVLSNEEWMNGLRSEQKWTGRRGLASSPSGKPGQQTPGLAPWGLFGSPFDTLPFADSPLARRGAAAGNTFRTVCVRLCDGYFFPISFSTTREHFDRDEDACQSRCPSGARLYVYRNGDGNPDDMVDITGHPYQRLKTAFLYRTAYEPSCKCKPHPWEQEARLQHRIYALHEERRKGSRSAVAELKSLKAATAQQTVTAPMPFPPIDGRRQPTPSRAQVEASGISAPPRDAAIALPIAEDAEQDRGRAKTGKGTRTASREKQIPRPMQLGAGGSGGGGVPSYGSGNSSEWKRKAFQPAN